MQEGDRVRRYLERILERTNLHEEEVLQLVEKKKELIPYISDGGALITIAEDLGVDISDLINYYEYIFSNPIKNLFELLIDLPSLLFTNFKKIEDPNKKEYTIQTKPFFGFDQEYKFKIIEKEPNKKIIYDYDFMKTSKGVIGRLTLILDEISADKVKVSVQNQILDSRLRRWDKEAEKKKAAQDPAYHHLLETQRTTIVCQPNFLGESLDDILKRQDIRKIFVNCKGKRVLVQGHGSGGLNAQGFTLVLDGLNITNIKNEVEGLENLTELTDLHLSNNRIKEITGLDNLVNLENLYLVNNKIEWISGLENLSNLRRLYLIGNNIHEIEGLENLTKLRILYLNNNKISEIRGLEKLEFLQIKDNPIAEDIINELGGIKKICLVPSSKM